MGLRILACLSMRNNAPLEHCTVKIKPLHKADICK